MRIISVCFKVFVFLNKESQNPEWFATLFMYYDSVIYDSFLDDLESKGKIKGTGSFDFDFVVLEFLSPFS